MHTQTFDAGIARNRLETYLIESGYWGDAEKRRRHQYVLSPSIYRLSRAQERALDRLARSTYGAVQSLNKRLVSLATDGQHLSHEEGRFVRLANVASRSLCRPSDGVIRIPPVIKVDLVQDSDGNFFIAEVDTYNPRGFGYAALLEDSVPEFRDRRYPGVTALAKHFTGADDWYVVVSDFERYYETPFRVLCGAFERRGKKLTIVHGAQLANGTMLPKASGILAIPESLDRHPLARERLLRHYKDNTHTFLYPPVAYLGSKAFLPYLRTCAGMDEFIPPTTLIGKHHENLLADLDAPMVLKAAVSSGMKGVYFSDLDPEYTQVLADASREKHARWVVQEQVQQEPIPIVVYEGDGSRKTREYFLRITAYVSENGVVDAEITGRTDRKVHGAPDCIQLPVVLTRH